MKENEAKHILGKKEITDEDITRVFEDYAEDDKKGQYLIDGALLTCDQATWAPFRVPGEDDIAPKGGYIEPDIWEGDRISFTGDGDIRYQVQYKSEDDACVLAVYFSYTDVRKQSENELLLRYDLQRRGWNESYLQQVLWGEWRRQGILGHYACGRSDYFENRNTDLAVNGRKR